MISSHESVTLIVHVCVHDECTIESGALHECKHKLDKFALRRLAQKKHRSKRQGLLPGSLLTTPSRRRPSRGSRHPQCSSSRRRRWRLDPGLHHLVASTGKKKKGEKGEQSNREYSSKVLASKELHYICMDICVKGHISGLNCRMPE